MAKKIRENHSHDWKIVQQNFFEGFLWSFFLANPLKNIKKYVLFSEIIPLWQDTGHTRWNCHHSMPKSARSSPSMGDLWQIELVGPTLVSTSAKSASHSIFLHWNDLNFCGPVHLIYFRYDSFYNLYVSCTLSFRLITCFSNFWRICNI